MAIDNLNKIASLVDLLDGQEKIALPLLAARAKKALNEHPEDVTMMSMANVLSRMSEKKMFITRAELNSVYRNFYTRNNSFAEVFAEELGKKDELKGPTLYNRAKETNVAEDYSKFADPVLANALESAFDKNQAVKLYSKKAAELAETSCANELAAEGIEPTSMSVAAGDESIILVRVAFDTPKGQTDVLVPYEVTPNGQAYSTDMFVSNRGSEKLCKANLVEYLNAFAGKQLKISANQVVELASSLKNGQKTVSAAEVALLRYKTASAQPQEFFANQITGLSVDNVKSDVNLPKVSDPEIDSFASKFDTAAGQANFLFGEKKVASARAVIKNKLDSFGLTAQASIAECTNDTVVFAVSLGRTAFKVPCKMAGTPSANVFICNGSVKSFDKQNIINLMVNEQVDYKAAAVASPLYSVKPSELVNQVKVAMQEKNYAKAEDALNVLSQGSDEKAYNLALGYFMEQLGPENKAQAEEATTCSRIISNATSKFQLCGHTGLPLHKVYQDKNGDCHPNYRKAMNESYEGGYFMAHKVLF